MRSSLVLTCHPFIHFRFQSEYQKASDAIWPFEKLARQIVSKEKRFRILTHWEQMRLIQKKAPHAVPHGLPVIRQLKREEISVAAFKQAVSGYPFSSRKKVFFQEIAALYEGYEDKGPWLDDEDVFQLASQQRIHPPLKQVLILAHELSSVEEKFAHALTRDVPRVERISLESLGSQKTELQLTQARTRQDEVGAIGDQIHRLIKRGVPLQNIFIFCAEIQDYQTLFSMVFERQGIPFSFWNEQRDLSRITILPWHPNTLVFAQMDTVFLAGLSALSRKDHLLSEEEKFYFNQRFLKEVFPSHGARVEKTKQLLHWVTTRVHRLHLSYVSSLSKPVHDFLGEYPFYTKKTALPDPFKREKKSVKSLSDKPDRFFRKYRDSVLPKVYSVRSLTQYQKCPQGFLVKECLRLLPPQPAADELTPLQQGELLHAALRRYFSALKEGQGVSLEEVLAECCKTVETRLNLHIFPPERFRLKQTLSAFMDQEQRWRTQDHFLPSFFEAAFGMADRPSLTLTWQGKSIQLKGVIDRIDVDADKQVFRVIDYKSGSGTPSEKEVMAGRHFQLTLYAIAVETLFLPGYRPKDGYFYRIKQADRRRAFEMTSESDWQALKERTLKEVFQEVDQIEALRFPGTPDRCFDSCELRNFCAQESH